MNPKGRYILEVPNCIPYFIVLNISDEGAKYEGEFETREEAQTFAPDAG